MVNMCCHQSSESFLGNIFNQTFEELWFSPLATEIRAVTQQGSLHKVCDTVRCPYRYTQKTPVSHPINENGYPTELEFDLHGSHCNFGGLEPTADSACIMCPRASEHFQSYIKRFPDRTDELVERIKHIVPHLSTMYILGVSEPFWKDKIFDVMTKLGHTHQQITTNTNGTPFTPKKQQQFLERVQKSHINFSIDAATPETFIKIRRYDFFHQICRNIENWSQVKGSDEHKVYIHNNINVLNVHEVPEMVMLAKRLGADCLTLMPTHDCDDNHPSVLPLLVNRRNAQQFIEAQNKATELAVRIGQKVMFFQPLSFGLSSELKLL